MSGHFLYGSSFIFVVRWTAGVHPVRFEAECDGPALGGQMRRDFFSRLSKTARNSAKPSKPLFCALVNSDLHTMLLLSAAGQSIVVAIITIGPLPIIP
jgi:hypothetical protein